MFLFASPYILGNPQESYAPRRYQISRQCRIEISHGDPIGDKNVNRRSLTPEPCAIPNSRFLDTDEFFSIELSYIDSRSRQYRVEI